LILVIVGSTPYPFTRLLQEIDRLAPGVMVPFFVQSGEGPYMPRNCTCFRFVPYETLVEYYRTCTFIIAHTSGGPLIYSRKFEKPIITIPRKKALGEAVADHQIEAARALREVNEPLRIIIDEVDELAEAIPQALALVKAGARYRTNSGITTLLSAIREACGLITMPAL
jgi:UDP-N-acetylglucosamine transferase subunit ALG13